MTNWHAGPVDESLPRSASQRFDPLRLRPDASLNRTRIAGLRDADPKLVGCLAFHLLSLTALEALQDADAPRVFSIRLAHLIASVVQPEPASATTGPWRRAYLRHWSRVSHVWLAGGLAARLGCPFLDALRAELTRLHSSCAVDIAPHPQVAALVGLARTPYRARTSGQVAVLDFGHSSIKRGIATIDNGRLARLAVLPALSAPAVAELAPQAVLECVADLFTWSSRDLDAHVSISLASYMHGGRPADSHSVYSSLAAPARAQLHTALRVRTGRPLQLRFVHDGTAAARALPIPARGAVIVLGTALAVGFPPPVGSVLPLADSFYVTSLNNVR